MKDCKNIEVGGCTKEDCNYPSCSELQQDIISQLKDIFDE